LAHTEQSLEALKLLVQFSHRAPLYAFRHVQTHAGSNPETADVCATSQSACSVQIRRQFG